MYNIIQYINKMGDEIWKVIDGFEKYEVSSFGRVRNSITGRVLRYATTNGGYVNVGLNHNYIRKSPAVHRLVAQAFIPNPENKPQVNHINKIRNDNRVENLEWTTALENNIHKINEMKENNKEITSNQKLKINKLDINGNILNTYNSIMEAAEELYNLNYSNNCNSIRSGISGALNKKNITSYGFKWELIEQDNIDNEIWKEIIIDNNLEKDKKYYISNLGRFKNYKGVIMEDYKPHHSGYIYVRVNKEKYAIHRLVALAFLENPENKPVVNHIDGNKINNKLCNLEWASVRENNLHNHKANLIKTFKRKIGQYDLENNIIKEFSSIKEAMDELKIQTIKHVLCGKQNIAGGFIWKYLD